MFTDSAPSMDVNLVHRSNASSQRRSEVEFRKVYRLNDIVDFVVAGGPSPSLDSAVCNSYQRVALQFPDELLHDSVCVVEGLKKIVAERGQQQTPINFFVLADTTFAPCCPDETTAQHYHADAMVHFGFACMSKSTRLPVFYVHQTSMEHSVDVSADGAITILNEAARALPGPPCSSTTIQIVVMVPSSAPEEMRVALPSAIADRLRQAPPAGAEAGLHVRVIVSCPGSYVTCVARPDHSVDIIKDSPLPSADSSAGWCINGAWVPNPFFAANNSTELNVVQRTLFLGSESDPQSPQLFLVNQFVHMRAAEHSAAQGFYDTLESAGLPLLTFTNPTSAPCRVDSMVQQRLRQRMFNVEVVKESTSIGILVASLAVEGYRATAEMLKSVIRASSTSNHRRRAYVIYVGHLNQYKIANFVDSVDCFIVISCPNARECHFPNKSDAFLKPVVSPVEVLIALDVCSFEQPEAFTTNFGVLLGLGDKYLQEQTRGSAAEASSEVAADNGTLSVADTIEKQSKDATSLVHVRTDHRAVANWTPSQGAIQRLHDRAYVGLDPQIGNTAVQESILEGRSGIAKGYATEKQSQAS